jgi:serine/threonine protein kinase
MKAERRRFRDTALASELIDEPQLAAAEGEVAVVLNRATADPVEWDKAVADRLVQQGLLTSFQVREMLAGRRRFRLGQYTVLDEIGKGGMGQVFRAEHAMMGREVAVKVLPRAKSTPESEAAFRREMRMLGRLDHENLVRAFDAGYDAQVYYLVTELVPGLDLKQQVVKYGPLDAAAAASVVSQAAQGLAYAHEKGLVHRDVKPGNILVMPDGRAKGLAGSTLEAESSRLGRVVGTMDYIAPEQIRMPDDVGPSADIYALGCTLYFAVTGRVPFPGGSRREKMHRHLHDAPEPVRKLAAHAGEDLCRLVEAMMAKAPANRIATANDVVERLRPWTRGGPMPMSRTPQPAGPAPSPQAADGGGAGPVWPREASPAALRSGAAEGDAPWFQPNGAAIIDSVRSGGQRLAAATRSRTAAHWARHAFQSLLIAAFGGGAFGGAMHLVRGINSDHYDKFTGGIVPSTLGWTAFFVLFLAQIAALLPGKHER